MANYYEAMMAEMERKMKEEEGEKEEETADNRDVGGSSSSSSDSGDSSGEEEDAEDDPFRQIKADDVVKDEKAKLGSSKESVVKIPTSPSAVTMKGALNKLISGAESASPESDHSCPICSKVLESSHQVQLHVEGVHQKVRGMMHENDDDVAVGLPFPLLQI